MTRCRLNAGLLVFLPFRWSWSLRHATQASTGVCVVDCLHLLPVARHQEKQFFFFCVRCDDRAKSSGRWLLGSPPSAVVRQLAPRAWCPLQCLLAKTVVVLSPCMGRSEECAQEFAPQSHIHSGLNQQDPISSNVFLTHSDQYAGSLRPLGHIYCVTVSRLKQ